VRIAQPIRLLETLCCYVVCFNKFSAEKDFCEISSLCEVKWSEVILLVSPFGFKFSQTAYYVVLQLILGTERWPVEIIIWSDHKTVDHVHYCYRIVSGFFNVPCHLISNRGHETGPSVYSSYPRSLESLTICRCNYQGSTFSSVILRPWVLTWPGSYSRPFAWHPDAQPTKDRFAVVNFNIMLCN